MRMISLITHNWHIKLLSLALASILWVYVNSLQEKERFTPLNLEVRNLPPGYVVANDLPEMVKVVLRGREEKLSLINTQRLAAYVDLRGSTRNSVNKVVRVSQQQMPGGVSIKEITPRLVEVKLEKASVKTIEVLPVIEGEPPYGYSLHNVELKPDSVKVRGPASRLREVESVYTGRIDISTMTETTVLQVPLERPGGKLGLVDYTHVNARVMVREEFVVRRLAVDRVHVEGLAEGLSYSFSPESVSALIRLPRRLAGSVGELRAVADCSGIDRPGVYQVPLKLDARRPGVELVQLEPDELSITVLGGTSPSPRSSDSPTTPANGGDR